jgi:glycosyltransferase involved in cell wall biosynthesis
VFRADQAKVRSYGLVAAGCGVSELQKRVTQLRAEGWDVRIVRAEADGTVKGVPLPLGYQVSHAHGDGPCERSDRLRMALEHLHRVNPFDLIEFPSRGGWAYRTLQAQRAQCGFEDVTITVRDEGTSSELRQQENRWPDTLSELEADYAESVVVQAARLHTGASTREPLVTICVPYYNLGQHLPTTLESLAVQTYPHIEVIVIDDGSKDAISQAVFNDMRDRYSRFTFLRQDNAGIGATRNRGLALAKGEYYLPMDADNIARPDMVERFVHAIEARPDVAAMTCYFLAFETEDDLAKERFLYAYRPTGGPHVLASLRNVYGDATAICRTEALRAIGGWETDRGTSFEDWEAFVKLVHAGYAIDVVPDHLFYYRYLQTGFSRQTDTFANHERVLRQFRQHGQAPGEVWDLLMGMHRRLEELDARQNSLRYRIVDRVHAACKTVFQTEN